MKRAFELIKKTLKRHPYVTVFLFAVIAWLPAVFIPFINDDYQILGYHTGKGWISLFRPFWTPDISNFYWRPLGNVLHPLILLTSGFHPVVFRIVSLVLYGLCCVMIARTAEKMGINRTIAALGAVLFAVLPSHEYQAAWIAEQGESLVTIFLLSAFYSYLNYFKDGRPKYLLIYFLLLLLAALIKESAFAGILIPAVAYFANEDRSRKRILPGLRDIFIGLAVILSILAYRWVFIGGTPFSSNHFAHSGIFRFITNFFIYIPLSFFSPESLEMAAGAPLFFILIAALAVIISAYFVLIYRKPVSLQKASWQKMLAALSWFIIFILPGLPTLMRWYAFTASIGLIWALSVLAGNIEKGSISRKLALALFLAVVVSASIYDFTLMQRWGRVGKRVDEAVASLNKFRGGLKTDSLYVWATPDKLSRIPMMKLGIQESVQWGLGDKSITVIAPLRAEMDSFSSRIELMERTDTSLVFHMDNGRFLPYGGQSRAIIKDESIETEEEGLRIRIRTFLNENNVPQSIAGIYFPSGSHKKPQLYFNGREFSKVE